MIAVDGCSGEEMILGLEGRVEEVGRGCYGRRKREGWGIRMSARECGMAWQGMAWHREARHNQV